MKLEPDQFNINIAEITLSNVNNIIHLIQEQAKAEDLMNRMQSQLKAIQELRKAIKKANQEVKALPKG